MYSPSDEFYDFVRKGQEGHNVGTPFTIDPFNRLVEGVLPDTYYLILGPSGSGKSSLVYEQFIFNFIDAVYEGTMDVNDIVIVLFSLEIKTTKFYSKASARFIYKTFKKLISTRDIANSKGNTSDLIYKMIYGKKLKKYLEILDKVVKIYTRTSAITAFVNLGKILAPLSTEIRKDAEGRSMYKFKNDNLKVITVLDHISLTDEAKGEVLKKTIDNISKKVFVRYRNSHGITPVVLQQITPSEDNMKKVVYSHKDARDSKNTYHDCDVCLSIGSPLEAEKISIPVKGGRYFIMEDEANGFIGLEDRARVVAKEKDREGASFKQVIVGFIGECAMFTDLGHPENVDYEFYKNLGK